MRTELPMLSHRVGFRGKEREVLTFPEPARHVFVRHDGGGGWLLFADPGGFGLLGEMAALVATSPDRIAFLRHWAQPDWAWLDVRHPWDLVFVHHTLQLPASSWISLRRQMRVGKKVSRRVRLPPADDSPYWRGRHDRRRNPVDLCCHGQTLVVSGSQASLFRLADSFDWMAGSQNHDHFHFQDAVRLRDHGSGWRFNSDLSDLICIMNMEWVSEAS